MSERIGGSGRCRSNFIRWELGLFHYLDYRPTQDVDAWWAEQISLAEKQEVIDTLQRTLEHFGSVTIRAWGDVVSIELVQDNKKVCNCSGR